MFKALRMLEDQKELIVKGGWDCLIVLDACRYDCFERVYKHYIDGELEKVLSPASETYEWCIKIKDVVYVSANPFINSKAKIKGFDARRVFYKVIDVWDFGWDGQVDTVPPEEVNKAAMVALRLWSRRRFIIHYLQPHAPYLSLAEGYRQYHGFEWKDSANLRGVEKVKELVDRLLTFSLKLPFIPKRWVLKLRLALGLKLHPLYIAVLTERDEGLRRVYMDNLERVLKAVSKLVPT